MRKLVIIAGLIVLADLGTGHAQPVPQPQLVRPKSTSPFEIARVVNQSTQQWNRHRLRVDVDLRPTWKHLGIDPSLFAGCMGDCQARLDRNELDATPGREVILKFTKSYDFCRYLIFTRVRRTPTARPRWKLLGYIDHDFNRYQMARHRVARAFGRNWLVIRGQEGSGSGYYLYGETWFEVSNRGVRPVLNYPVDGHTDPVVAGLKWELKGRATALTNGHKRQAIIRFNFNVLYTANGFGDSQFTRRFLNRRHADYVWHRESRQFVFAGDGSTISEAEMQVIASGASEPSMEDEGVKAGESTFFSSVKGFVGSGFEMFLKLNVHRLTKIAWGHNNQAKEWLGEFLKECDDIPQKLALEKALPEGLSQSRKQR